MKKTEERKSYLHCWVAGTPEEVEKMKSAIVGNKGNAYIQLWSDSRFELIKSETAEKTKEKVSVNGKVYAYAPNEGEVENIFIAKGEPHPSEHWGGRTDIDSYLSIYIGKDILHPIELIPDGIELGFNMEYCRPANQAEVDLLKKVLYERNLVWDADKKRLVERKKREAWEPEEGELCWVCYNHGEGYNFKPMLVEYDSGYCDKLRHGLVFKIKQECHLMCDKLNQAIHQATINELNLIGEIKEEKP